MCWFDQLRGASEAKNLQNFSLVLGRNGMQGLEWHASAARCARNFIGHWNHPTVAAKLILTRGGGGGEGSENQMPEN